jgi:flagellar hook-associated protein 1 FlgK
MGGLNTILSVATGALSAQEAALETTNTNIANADTPGYSREIVNLSSAGTTIVDGISVGAGVTATGVTSVRDELLSLLVEQQTSSQGAASAQGNVLNTVQSYFSGTTNTVGAELSAFFTSLSALSSSPSSSAQRQTVISNAQAVVQAFNNTSAGLTSTQSGLSTQIAGDVTQINSLASQIASLNIQIVAQGSAAAGASSLVDQRSALEQQLSAITNVDVTTTAQGDTVSTGNGTPLVVAGQSLPLTTGNGSSGLLQVFDSAGNNITDSLTGGDLGGMITARDTQIPAYLAQLDTIANGFANAVNAAQSTGYDLAGNPGAALFTVPSTVTGSAAGIALSTTSGDAIAASSDGTTGSNGNLAALTAAQDTAVSGTLSSTDAYAALVDAVGNGASQASTQSTALQTTLTQLTNQQNSVSGVSTDEESSNLIKFQQGYQAAAEVVSTLETLFSATINMLTDSGGA